MNKGLNYKALYGVVLLWSLSPTIVYGFKGGIHPIVSCLVVISIAFAFTALVVLLHPKVSLHNCLEFITTIFSERRNRLLLLALGILGFGIYPLCFFYGIHKGQPVQATVVNYLWPIFGAAFTFTFEKIKMSGERISGLVICFIGVISLNFLGEGNESINHHDGINPLLLSFAGAIIYGLYTALVRQIALPKISPTAVAELLMFASMLFVAFVFHLVVSGIFLFHTGFAINLDVRSASFLVFYSLLILAGGHFLWLFANRRLKVNETASTVYLVPVLSTIIISVYTEKILTEGLLVSLSFILVGIYLCRHNRILLSPFASILISVVCGWGVLSLGELISPYVKGFGPSLTIAVSTLKILVSIFAILAGFSLSRAVLRTRELQKSLLSLEAALVQLAESNRCNTTIREAVDDLMSVILNQYYKALYTPQIKSAIYSRDGFSDNKAMINLTGAIAKIKDKKDRRCLTKHVSNIRTRLGVWHAARIESMTAHEWILFMFLVGNLLLMIQFVPRNGIMQSWLTIGFSASLLMICFTIREIDKGRGARKVGFFNSQRVSEISNRPPYVPEAGFVQLMRKIEFTFMGREIRTLDDDGKIQLLKKLNHKVLDGPTLYLFLQAALIIFYFLGKFLVNP